jgi:hypothetical protein
MKDTANPQNELKAGVTPELLTEAVRSSGYPLQIEVAQTLSEIGCWVTEEWGYEDRTTGEHRALDVYGDFFLARSPDFNVYLTLLTECKRSDLPYVFFVPASLHTPDDFPTIVGLPWHSTSLFAADASTESPPYREVPFAYALCGSDLPFVEAPTIVATFVRAERKDKNKLQLSGEDPYRQIVLPLASAVDHLKATQLNFKSQVQYRPLIVLSVAVLDAPMIVARGTPEQPQLSMESWVRVVRQESRRESGTAQRTNYVVDVVHRNFLKEYLSKHAIPFATVLAERILEHPAIFTSGKALVPTWGDWTWDQIRPQPEVPPPSERIRLRE